MTNGDGSPVLELTSEGNVTLQCGASLTLAAQAPDGATLRISTPGALLVETDARVDATDGGYGVAVDGEGPSWVELATPENAGGSHGGRGTDYPWPEGGAAGEVFDSVYQPVLAGGSGSGHYYGSFVNRGSYGGGVVDLTVGELDLRGDVLAMGGGTQQGGGGGGSVRIHAGTIRGGGSIDASGDSKADAYGSGGGGRVALFVDQLDGFDVSGQVRVLGAKGSKGLRSAPGTVFWFLPGDTYGRLRVDADLATGTAPVLTELPTLGTGSVSQLDDSGADAWLTTAEPFRPRWVGTWVTLLDANGSELGSFQVADLDGAGRLRLEGAATTAGAATFRGEYRFDVVELAGRAGLTSVSPVVTPRLEVSGGGLVAGDVRIDELVVSDGVLEAGPGLEVTNLRLESGAVVQPLSGQPLVLDVPGTLTVEAGAKLDASGKGYGAAVDGQAPSWVVATTREDAGGSHGGRGTDYPFPEGGTAGEVYDSVYAPALGGASGSGDYYGSWEHPGSYGGGIVDLTVGELDLEGEILALGGSEQTGGGAGGSIRIEAGTLRGAGSIDASGGSKGAYGGGGGGRIAIVANVLDGFDISTQVRAVGALGYARLAAPGTVFWRLPGDTYGQVRIDAVETSGMHPGITELPVLAAGSFVQWEVEGADAWASGAEPFRPRWVGAWMVLTDPGGSDLGSFQVSEIDASGRARLAGAGSVAAAASYRGEYRFDRVEVANGAGLRSDSPLVTPQLETSGEGALEGDLQVEELVLSGGVVEAGSQLTATNLRVTSGTVLKPVRGEPLVLTVPGTLTVESGASLDASSLGYGVGVDGQGPPWVVPSKRVDTGGSHGGRGTDYAYAEGGTPGDVYDSVYEPVLAGASGAGHYWGGYSYYGSYGGGAIDLTVGELDLEGDILALGGGEQHGGGAGGSVRIHAGTLRGGGSIDASGGSAGSYAGGGGGRIAIIAEVLDGFDIATQARALGALGNNKLGAAGTIYWRLPAQVYGRLRLDAGASAASNPRGTDLPLLGGGDLSELETAGADAWVSAAEPFHPRWLGAWMVLLDAGGSELGSFQVADLDETGRARLAGAASVTGAVAYRGEYRFDSIELKGGAGVATQDPVVVAELDLDDAGTVEGPLLVDTLVLQPSPSGVALGEGVVVQNLTLASGATLHPPSSAAGVLHLVVPGTLTIEAGASIDVTAHGYGGDVSGLAPAGVAASTVEQSGGSHGGQGTRYHHPYGGQAGEIFGNVYDPATPGGAGVGQRSNEGMPGGGILELEAGDLVVDGEILARGGSCQGGSGAGGSIHIGATTISGSGLIDASGGDHFPSLCGSSFYGGGGGGRIAIDADVLDGFDVANQVRAAGGTAPLSEVAAAGTVLWRLPGDSYGRLRVDGWAVSGKTVLATGLPAIGRGWIGTTEVDATDPENLWIEDQDPLALFGFGVTGAVARVGGVDYPVIDQSADRHRLLLAGAAGAVVVGDEYIGVYKFDELQVTGQASFEIEDGLEVAGAVTVDPGSVLTHGDLTAPEISITEPAQGELFYSGDAVLITAEVTDDSGTESVTFTFGEQGMVDTEAPWAATFIAPLVETEETVGITVEAVDIVGNEGTATSTIQVQPLAPGDPPDVAVICPSAGAPLIAGGGLDLTVAASHADGIERVELLVGDDPAVVATVFVPPYTFRVDAPAGAVEGDVVTFHGRARSYAGTTAEATYTATVVAGSVISVDTDLGPADLSLDGSSVVVTSGTLTIEGPHSFRDLVVLDGAVVNQPVGESLQLTLGRDLYLGCGGAIDLSGRGWPAKVIDTGFTSGDLAAWSVWDVPGANNAPSNWWLDPSGSGYLRQSSNIAAAGGIDRLGTNLTYDAGGQLTDYRIESRFRSDDDDGIGFLFRYQDEDNHYRFLWNGTGQPAEYARRIEKRVGGTYVTLAQDTVSYTSITYYELELVADGPHIQVLIDGSLVFDVVDDEFASGTFGMTAFGNDKSIWDNLRVTALSGSIPDRGGNHAGRAGGFAGTGRIYGSLFDPDLPGTGGTGTDGTSGGGVMRLAAGGDAVIDGLISASGATDAGTGAQGAGGSVRLDAAAIGGLGSIDASGGGSSSARRGRQRWPHRPLRCQRRRRDARPHPGGGWPGVDPGAHRRRRDDLRQAGRPGPGRPGARQRRAADRPAHRAGVRAAGDD